MPVLPVVPPGCCQLFGATDEEIQEAVLSVFDASIMPDVPSGFTHIPTIMIAERLSELLASGL